MVLKEFLILIIIVISTTNLWSKDNNIGFIKPIDGVKYFKKNQNDSLLIFSKSQKFNIDKNIEKIPIYNETYIFSKDVPFIIYYDNKKNSEKKMPPYALLISEKYKEQNVTFNPSRLMNSEDFQKIKLEEIRSVLNSLEVKNKISSIDICYICNEIISIYGNSHENKNIVYIKDDEGFKNAAFLVINFLNNIDFKKDDKTKYYLALLHYFNLNKEKTACYLEEIIKYDEGVDLLEDIKIFDNDTVFLNIVIPEKKNEKLFK